MTVEQSQAVTSILDNLHKGHCMPPPPSPSLRPILQANLGDSPCWTGAGRATGLHRLALDEALQPVEITVALPGVGAQVAGREGGDGG